MIPKFRGWDKTHQKLGLIDADISDGVIQSVKIFDDDEDDWQEPDNFILMQSTGLKDKNGKEIFEGDVIVVEDDDIVRPVVKYIEGTFCLMSGDTCVGHLADYYQDSEVIGNIHENPELVGG